MTTLVEAQRVLHRLAPLFHAVGYLTALYGSVLTYGQGRDVDVLLVPWRPASPGDAWHVLRVVGAVSFDAVYEGAMGTESLAWELDGVRLDIQVRFS